MSKAVRILACLTLAAVFPQAVYASATLNEFVVNASTEWVEFFNASDSAQYLMTWFIDDDTDFESDAGNSAKKQLTTLNVTSAAYPYIELANSMFNNNGDSVVLFSSDGTLVDSYTYSTDPGTDGTVGRLPDGTGEFGLLSSATKGSANAPAATPVPTETNTPTATNRPTSTPSPGRSATATPSPVPTVSPINAEIETPDPTVRIVSIQPIISISTLSAQIPGGTVLGAAEIGSQSATAATGMNSVSPYMFASLSVGTGMGLLAFALAWQKKYVSGSP